MVEMVLLREPEERKERMGGMRPGIVGSGVGGVREKCGRGVADFVCEILSFASVCVSLTALSGGSSRWLDAHSFVLLSGEVARRAIRAASGESASIELSTELARRDSE